MSLDIALQRPPAAAAPATAAGLAGGFLRAARAFPHRPALEVDGRVLTYGELLERAAAVAATLQREDPSGPPLVGIYAYRTEAAFVGILGTLLSGRGYVPLNPMLPAQRNRLMLEQAGCQAVVSDAASAPGLDEVLPAGSAEMTIVVPDAGHVGALSARATRHRIIGAQTLETAGAWRPVDVDPADVAYVLFTSGSTGVPKGVTVAHRNVAGLIDAMVARYGITEQDRISQTHELTFDVSVWDMFVTWERGACLCCPSRQALISPGRFIRESGLTVWFSVPSTAIMMKRLGQLKPHSYPGLRWSLFAGEPLPVAVAEAWLEAASHGVVENLYGPTELTIVCFGYRWDPARSPGESEAGTVPMGYPLPGNEALVVDAELHEVPPGDVGELLVRGEQVTQGYWRDAERTAKAFLIPPGQRALHYRTGDRVRRPAGAAPMTYLGRLDNQVKVRGVRVELGEIEAALREATGVDAVVALGWPRTPTGVDGIVAFVGGLDVDLASAERLLSEQLPPQMLPRQIRLLAALPLNGSGKFDRQALQAQLEDVT